MFCATTYASEEFSRLFKKSFVTVSEKRVFSSSLHAHMHTQSTPQQPSPRVKTLKKQARLLGVSKIVTHITTTCTNMHEIQHEIQHVHTYILGPLELFVTRFTIHVPAVDCH